MENINLSINDIVNGRNLRKHILFMKVFFLLCMTAILNIHGNAYSQTVKVSVSARDMPIEDILNQIEDQSEFYFLYNQKLVDLTRKVSIQVSNKPINEVLDILFDKSKVGYVVHNRQIIISPINQARQSQQGIVITGTVTDTGGDPLPGVNVVVKGSTTGTVTDMNGMYQINITGRDAVLVFSFIGYVTKEVMVDNNNRINIELQEDLQELEEVIVVGYGTVRKKDLTGAVASLGGDEISGRKATQVSQALQGAMPGVLVTRDNNAPGSTASIKVRGITTIGDSNPLIIVDGMQVDDINDINPNDIESMSVLKDAASASIYGSQAAAGVILITTKRAKAEQFSLEYNFEYGMEIPTRTPEYVDAVRFMEMTNELRWNDNGNGTNRFPTYTEDYIKNYLDNHKVNPDVYPVTDWTDLMLKSYASRQSHLIKIMGGNKIIRTAASLAYDDIGALYDNRTFERITARINNDLTINKYLAASIDVSFKRVIDKQASMDPMNVIRISAPIYAATWSDGRIAEGKTGANIYGQIKDGGYNHYWHNQVGAKIALDFMPVEGLKISGIFSPTLNNSKAKKWRTAVPWYTWDDPSVFGGYLQWAATTSLNEERNDNYRLMTQFLVNYDKTFRMHHTINLLAGYENRYAFNEDLSASRDEYELDTYPYLNLGPLKLRNNSGTAYENTRRSFFGRIMYSYKSKYLLQANIRYDASSRFADGYRWGAFPSVSAGWVLSEESFMHGIPALSFLKVRASWGTLGNERTGAYVDGKWVPEWYPYQATIEFGNSLLYQGDQIVSQKAAAQWRYAIHDITWETTETYDIGLDAHFFNNRLRFTGDYYKKKTRDMLLPLQIPTYMGFDNPDQNTGKMHTTGWELQLGWHDKINDWGYSVSFNISDFRSKMGDLGGTEFLGDKIKVEGSEFDEWYGYRSKGIYQTQDEVDNSAKTSASIKPGDLQYIDINGAGEQPDGKISGEYDRVLLGGSQARYTYGGNIGVSYKNIDLGIVVQGVGKQNSRISRGMVEPLRENWAMSLFYWTERFIATTTRPNRTCQPNIRV